MSYQNPQGRIEGFEVDTHRARMSGYWDVTDEEDDQISLDRVVVMIVAARSEGVTFKITDTGDVQSARVLRVQDAVPLGGDLREQAIQMLADRADPNQIHMSFPGGPSAPPASPSTSSPAVSPSQVNSPSTAVHSSSMSDPDLDDDPDDIDDMLNQAPVAGPTPPVANDRSDDIEETASGLGSVYPDGHVGKDKHLARFMQQDDI